MLTTSQDVLYLTVSICIGLFTIFLVWIMYYIAQISKQSNEIIADFRQKLEEFNETVQVIKEKVNLSVDRLTSVSDRVATILDVVTRFAGNKNRRRNRSSEED